MPDSDPRPKVTVEDLLQLKRAERPAPEFWSQFERELRQKQLTALLEKRPWWRELPQLLARRAYLPVGATAILAFTLVSVKYYAPTQVAQPTLPPAEAPIASGRELVAPTAPVSSPLVNRSESVAPTRTEVVAAASTPVVSDSTEPVELMPMLVAPRETERPSSRMLAGNISRLDQSGTDFTGAALNPTTRTVAVAVPAAYDELASVPAQVSRRNRLLAQYENRQPNPEPTPHSVVRERLTRRLGEPETVDRSGRFARDIDSFAKPLPQIVALRF